MSKIDPNSGHADEADLLDNALPMPSEEGVEELDELAPLEVEGIVDDDAEEAERAKAKIQQFSNRKVHVDHWKRTPNATGAGAIHVKTFVAKLRLDAIEHLDTQVNEWLDDHPEYEVKFVTTAVGRMIGKNTEEAMFMNVWV